MPEVPDASYLAAGLEMISTLDSAEAGKDLR